MKVSEAVHKCQKPGGNPKFASRTSPRGRHKGFGKRQQIKRDASAAAVVLTANDTESRRTLPSLSLPGLGY